MNDFNKDDYWDWEKDDEKNKIWWSSPIDSIGGIVFTFDKKTVFDFWQDYPEKLTDEQIQIFKKENPTLAALKPTN